MNTKRNQINVRVRSEDTDGRLAVMENGIPAGFAGPPLHVHPSFDEAFYVLEGELIFQVEDEFLICGAGTLTLARGDTPHTFANLSGRDARILLICAPGGFERRVDRRAAEQAGKEPPEPSGPMPEVQVLGPQIDPAAALDKPGEQTTD